MRTFYKDGINGSGTRTSKQHRRCLINVIRRSASAPAMCAEHIVDYTCTQADPGAYFAHPQAAAAHLRHPADTAVDTLPYPQDATTSIVGFGSLTKLGDPNNYKAAWVCLPLSVGFARNVTVAQLHSCRKKASAFDSN